MPDDQTPVILPVSPGLDTPVAPPSVQVTNSLPPPDSLNNLDQEDGAGIFGWGQVVSYHFNHGYVGQPVAAPYRQALAEILRLHSGIGYKSVCGCAFKFGGNPPIPDPTPQSPNEVLAISDFSFFTPQNLPDGEGVTGAVWSFIYLLQVFPGPGDQLDAGAAPYSTLPSELNRFDPTQFSSYLLGAPASVSPIPNQTISKLNY